MKGDGLGRTDRWWLVLALALATWILVRGQADFIASDPLWYAVIAHDIAHGTQHFSAAELHPFVMRVGLAALYRVFGVSTLVSNLPAIGSGLSCLVLLCLTGRTRRRTLIALGLGLTCAALMHQSIALNVDVPCAALLGFSTYFISPLKEMTLWSECQKGGRSVFSTAVVCTESAV